jgi:hypothetical protein
MVFGFASHADVHLVRIAMASEYDQIPPRTKGAWVIHHGRKTNGVQGGGAAFPTIDTVGRTATLLSSLAASDETTLQADQVEALAAIAGINPKLELNSILDLLKRKRLIDSSSKGAVVVGGLTTAATAGHAAELFEDLKPSSEEMASILVAEKTTASPKDARNLAEELGDEFSLSKAKAKSIVDASSRIGFVDAEGSGTDEIIFNGNIFRKDSVAKITRILNGLSSKETRKIAEVEALLDTGGCIALAQVEKVLGSELMSKLRSAGMYDIQFVHNPAGEFGFVTRPAAFHKFQDPMVDDTFDLAKALVAALYYGMTQSSAGRGKITMLRALVRNLVAGLPVGPATAIGQDYKVLEEAGVLRTWRDRYGFSMELRKKDIGEMALNVLTSGDVSTENVTNPSLIGKMVNYTNPEAARWEFRQTSKAAGIDHGTRDFLETLRTRGAF